MDQETITNDNDEVIDIGNVTFPNGDKYQGQWNDNTPHGYGIYNWANGTSYEGYWRNGLLHGKGKYTWSNGASYTGEWYQGYMHGSGIYESPQGYKYQGGFYRDLRHGLGKKVYQNGDYYEGIYKNGKRNGPGRYNWSDGNTYDGEWKNNKFHGRGLFVWANQERYDGEWKDGNEEGFGTFTSSEGTYEGFWRRGRRHSTGIFYPDIKAKPQLRNRVSVIKQKSVKQSPQEDQPNPDAKNPFEGGAKQQQLTEDIMKDFKSKSQQQQNASIKKPLNKDQRFSIAQKQDIRSEYSEATPKGMDKQSGANVPRRKGEKRPNKFPSLAKIQEKEGHQGDFAYIREYNHSVLVREEPIDRQIAMQILGLPLYKSEESRQKFARTKKVPSNMLGETIYKGHPNYDLMLNLQHGIRWTVQSLESSQMPSQIKSWQYTDTVEMWFNHHGSKNIAPHQGLDFIWKDYAPQVFRKLRDIYDENPGNFIQSICGHKSLTEVPSPGKSGSMFYVSKDARFFIKTITKQEAKFLINLLPKYFKHMDINKHSLLPRIYGLHKLGRKGSKYLRFLVMGNVFTTDLLINRRYDLKGSKIGRRSKIDNDSPELQQITLKDLDLNQKFMLEKDWFVKLKEYLRSDCDFLEINNIMDYSLLLGIHYRSSDGDHNHHKQENNNNQQNNQNGQPPQDVSQSQNNLQQEQLSQTQQSSEQKVGQSEQRSLQSPVPQDQTSAPETSTNVNLETLSLGAEEKQFQGIYGNEVLEDISKYNKTSMAWLLKVKEIIYEQDLDERIQKDLLRMAIKKILSRQTQPKEGGNISIPKQGKNKKSDQQAHSAYQIGHSRLLLGQGLEATAFDLRGDKKDVDQPVILYFGIIDMLQTYTAKKQAETFIKMFSHRQKNISSVNPYKYGTRFQTYLLNKVFNSESS